MAATQAERELAFQARRFHLELLGQVEPVIVVDSNMWLRLKAGEPPRWFWSEPEARKVE